MPLIPQDAYDSVGAGNTDLLHKRLMEMSEDDRQSCLKDGLLRAVYEGKDRAVQALLKLGASPAVQDRLAHTPLHWAARQGFEGISQALVSAQASIQAENRDRITPLHLAAQSNSGSIVQMLLSQKADIAALTVDQRSVLHFAAESGAAVATAVLLGKAARESEKPSKQDLHRLEAVTDRGETPLARAAARGHGAVVQLLLQAGSKMEHANCFGQVALYLACFGGHVGAAEVLLKAKADPNVRAEDGSTPLHGAAERGHVQVVELLLASSVNWQSVAAGGRTPLHVAAERGFADVAEALLANGAEPEEARTALICAAARGHVLVVAKLLDFQADVQALDKMNQTALHAASVGGKAECIQLLHKKRARLEQKDGSGRTPMQLALDCKEEGSIRQLLKLRAVMPEEAAKKPEMQPLIQEVEREVLLEQLKEAELLCGKQQLKDAEQAFEDARQHLLRLIQLSETARVTPVIQNAEYRLSDLQEQCRVCKQEASRTEAKIKETEAELTRLQSEHKEQSKDLALLRRDLDSLRAAKSKKMEELQNIKQLIQQVLKAIQDAKSKDSGVDAETQKALKRIEELKKQLEKLKASAATLQREWDELNAKCQKFDQEKAEVAALHARAKELLSKPGRV